MVGRHIAVKRAFADELNQRSRFPSALLIRKRKHISPSSKTHAIGVAEAGGDDLEPVPVGRDADHAATMVGAAFLGAFAEIKIPLSVLPQIGGETVVRVGNLHVVVQALVIVSLAVPVQIVQPNESVVADDVHVALINFQAKRVGETGGKPPPPQVSQFRVDAVDDPNFAVCSADGSTFSAFKKVVAGDVKNGVVRVVEGQRDFVDDISLRVTRAQRALSVHGNRPTRCSALGQALG